MSVVSKLVLIKKITSFQRMIRIRGGLFLANPWLKPVKKIFALKLKIIYNACIGIYNTFIGIVVSSSFWSA